MNNNVNWQSAYNRLHRFLEGFTGPQFIKAVQQFDPDLLDYNDYIAQRSKEGKSTTKKVYFKDILLSYPDNVKRKLFEYFLTPYSESHSQELADILTLLNGGIVGIDEKIFDRVSIPTQTVTPIEKASQDLLTQQMPEVEQLPFQQETLPTVVILTAIEEEYTAVRKHLSEIEEVQQNDTHYEKGVFIYEGRRVASVVIRECGAKNSIAAQETERAIHYFKPDAILFVGIAGSRKPHDFGIGDVIVPEKIYSYEGGKAEVNAFASRPDLANLTYTLLEITKTERRKSDWKSLIKGELQNVVKANLGVIASGEKIVEHYNSDIGKILKEHFNDTSAVEMEGFGFAKAASRQGRNMNGMLVGIVRGISDIIEQSNDSNTDEAMRRPTHAKTLASNTAAAFAFWLILKAFPK